MLVLGSLPGDASLAAGRYYAHPRNLFWHLIGTVIGQDITALDYEQRLTALTDAGIGLWDTVASAVRPGSLDTAIRAEMANPLGEMVAGLPRLRAVAFNGGRAARLGGSLLAASPVAQIALPSSSPAYAAMPLAQKERLWAELRKFLD